MKVKVHFKSRRLPIIGYMEADGNTTASGLIRIKREIKGTTTLDGDMLDESLCYYINLENVDYLEEIEEDA